MRALTPSPFRRLALAAMLAAGCAVAMASPRPLGAQGVAAPQAAEAGLDAAARSAVQSAERAMAVVRRLRERSGPGDAGRAAALQSQTLAADRLAFVGAEMTPLVTTLGSLDSKLLSTDPRWAGLIVRQLASRGVKPGSAICASFSGSFPALNLAVVVAGRALGAHVIAISSVTASSWGANEAGLTWPEMEAAIVEAGVTTPATVAISLGGTRDSARDLQPAGQALARRIQSDSARRLGAQVLQTETLAEAISARLAAYRRVLNGRPLAVYVNVGGNHASLGGANAPLRHDGGWLMALPEGGRPTDSVMFAYLAERVPVLSLLNVKGLAQAWGFETR